MNILTTLIILALIATVISLGWGVISMGRGGAFDERHADQFMGLRLAFQGIALALMVVAMVLSL